MTPETTIISNSNLSRPELLAMRRDKFEEGTHWRRNKSRRGRIEWTSAGVEGLADETGVEIGDLLRIEDDVLDGIVTWAGYPNTSLIQAKLKGVEGRVLVKVKNSRLYLPGMKCEVRRNGERGWMESKRPRSRGRF